MDRRQFLTGLGVFAGAGLIAPLVGRPSGEGMVQLDHGRTGLGTWTRIVARHADGARASRAVEKAFAAIDEVDRQMSIHRSDSQLSAVNAAAGLRAVPVAPEVREVTRLALDTSRRSGGVYDPTVLNLMKLYGYYGTGRTTYPTDREIATVLDPMGWQNVRQDDAAGTLGLSRAGAGLDFGSIGKGWAVDRAVAALRAEGIHSGLVDIGGNVYGLGSPGDGAAGWSVGVFHPRTGETLKVYALRDQAVATSADTEQYRLLSQVRVGHHFDARRGRPGGGHISVTILAATGMESDAFSSTAFLLGPDRFRGWPGALDAFYIG